MLGSFNHGSMANAMPQAIWSGTCMSRQQVIAFCGDGGLFNDDGRPDDNIQYKLPVKIIVFNNRTLGMVKLEMEVAGIPDLETEMMNLTSRK